MDVIRREMEVCENCGHSVFKTQGGSVKLVARVYATKVDVSGNVVRYRKCGFCGSLMPTEVLIKPKSS